MIPYVNQNFSNIIQGEMGPNQVPLRTQGVQMLLISSEQDRDVFDFLAQGPATQPSGMDPRGNTSTSFPPGPRVIDPATAPGAFGVHATLYRGGHGLVAPPSPLSPGELGMLMKSIQAFVPQDFPKFEPGDPATRVHRLLIWQVSIDQDVLRELVLRP